MKLAGKELTGPEMGAGLAGAALVLGICALGQHTSPQVELGGVPGASTPEACSGKLNTLISSGQKDGPVWRVGSIEEGAGSDNCATIWKDDRKLQSVKLTPGMILDACYPSDFSYNIEVKVINELGSVDGTVRVSDTFRDTMSQQLSQCVPDA